MTPAAKPRTIRCIFLPTGYAVRKAAIARDAEGPQSDYFPKGVGTIIRPVAEFAWMLAKWTAGLAVCVAVALGFYYYHRLDDEIRSAVEAKFAAKYPALKVSVREAQLVRGEGLRIRGLSIVEPNNSGPEDELLHVEELFVHCGTDMRDLLNDSLHVTRLTIRKPVLRATLRADGTWSASRLLPIPKFGEGNPAGVIEGGTIELLDNTKPAPTKLVLRDADAKWAPAAGDIRSLHVTAHAVSDHLRAATLDALLDLATGSWSLTGSIDALNVSPELQQSIPSVWAGECAKLGSLRAKAQARFRLAYQPAKIDQTANAALVKSAGAFDFQVEGQITEGRLDDPRLPYPATELSAKFLVNREGLALSDVSARFGAAALRADLQRSGLGDGAPLRLTAATQRLKFDDKMLALLPEPWKVHWNNFLPAGEVDLDAAIVFDGQDFRPDVTLRCRDASFTYHKFPYRLERAQGTIELHGSTLTYNLTASAGAEPVQLSGNLQLDGTRTVGWTEIRGSHVLIDERLLKAVSETTQPFARSLHPQGRFDVAMRTWKDAADESPWHKHAVYTLHDCSIRYDKFNYPLTEINGTVSQQDDLWTFHDDLRAVNDTGRIGMRGQLTPAADGGELQLFFHGDNVPIDDELRNALNPGAQRLWNDMKPSGMLTLDSELRYRLRDKTLTVALQAQPVGDTVSIEPAYFPYRLDKVHGVFTLVDGRLQIEQLRGEHGRTKVAAWGDCRTDPSGAWQLQLERLFVDRLEVDRDLLQALPESLKRTTGSLAPGGFFNIRGAATFAGSGMPDVPLTSEWNVTIDCQDNNVQCGIELHAIHGSAWVAGKSDGRRFEAVGELQLDSVSYGDYQFTEVLGPLWVDNEQVLFGFWADRRRGQTPERHLTGKLYGGSLVADGWVVPSDEPEYAVLATLSQADLARFAQETMPGRSRLSGEILAKVDLRGKGKTRDNLQGRGYIQLRNADIYEMPAMVSLLKVLSLRAPDSTGFTKSDINFSIQGEHVYLERIDFDGAAISLQGRGELNLANDQINLVFRTVVGSDAARLPAVKQLLGGASQQILLIHVGGVLQAPQIRREAFPGVNQVLEQLQAELQRPLPPNLPSSAIRTAPPGKLFVE